MAIPIKEIKEGCCDNDLGSLGLTVIDGDALDNVKPTCDKIIECPDKYILVEEKSFLLGFLHRCCQELRVDFETYKYKNVDTIYLKMSDLTELIHILDPDVKDKILAQTVTDLFLSSLEKVSNTTFILATKFDCVKAENKKIFYLYCKSGKAVDTIMSVWMSSYNRKKKVFIECTDLKNYLQRCC